MAASNNVAAPNATSLAIRNMASVVRNAGYTNWCILVLLVWMSFGGGRMPHSPVATGSAFKNSCGSANPPQSKSLEVFPVKVAVISATIKEYIVEQV